MTEENAISIGAVLRLIARSDGAVILHSSGGKDRVGIVCALAMLLCNIPIESVASDYALSQGLKEMLYQADVADPEESVLNGLTDNSPELSSRASTMVAYLRSFVQLHGSVTSWFADRAGLGAEDVHRLRSRMLQPKI